jgi:hypothetical protein
MSTPTRAFVKSLFEKAVNKKLLGLTLDIVSFGEAGEGGLSVGPHPGFEPTSFVMSFESDGGSGWQCAFAEIDIEDVREFIEALQGWVEFIEENRLGDKDK